MWDKLRSRRLVWLVVGAAALLSPAHAQSVYQAFEEPADGPEHVSQPDISAVAGSIDGAIKHTPELARAGAQLSVAHSERIRAIGGFLPSIEGSGVYTNDNWRSTPVDPVNNPEGVTLGLTIRQPIFQGLATVSDYRAAQAGLSQARQLLIHTREQVAFSAAQAHASVIRARTVVSRREENLVLVRRQLEITQRRMEAGAQSRTGVEQAQMRTAQAQISLEQARAELSAVEAAFRRAIGRAPPSVLTSDEATGIHDLTSIDQVIAAVRETNPSVHAAEYAYKAARHLRTSARSEFAPDLSIEGNFNKHFDENTGAPVVRDDTEYQIVARLRIPLFVQGQNIAGLKRASADLTSAKAQQRQTTLIVEETVTRAWREMETADRRRIAAAIAIDAAQEAVRGLQLEFEAGRRTVIDVLDGQRDLVESEISLAQAVFDFQVARYELLATLGVLAPTYVNISAG